MDKGLQTGFTLVEVLVAMAATVLIGTIAYGFFESAMTATAGNEQLMRETNNLEALWALLESDLQYAIPAGNGGDDQAEAIAVEQVFQGGSEPGAEHAAALADTVLQFIHQGWSNPLGSRRSDLQGVAYQWRDEQLLRVYWPYRNQLSIVEPRTERLLLDDVSALQLRFLPDTTGAGEATWLDRWPPSALAASQVVPHSAGLPLAVELSLTIRNLGDVQRIFTLPQR